MGKPNYCAIKDCHNKSLDKGRFGRTIKLHKLPKEGIVRSAWLRAISRKDFKPSTYTSVCSDHFPRGEGRTSVHKVPSLHLPQKVVKEGKVRNTKTSLSTSISETESILQPSISHSESDQPKPCSIDVIEQTHSYSKTPMRTLCESGTESENVPLSTASCTKNDKIIQTNTPPAELSVQVTRPEIIIDDIASSDEEVLFYTGLPCYQAFKALFDTLIAAGADRMNVDDEIMMQEKSYRKLRLIDEFFMVMMRLRLGLLLNDLQYRFKISTGRVSRIFNSWISLMATCLKSTVFLPPLQTLQQKVPDCFKNFSDTRIVLDCTEIFIETPSALENKSLTYSSYKSHNTFKSLVGVSMTGAVVFLSNLWGGSASDVHITRNCGLLELLEEGDAVMVDKGFIHIQSDLKKKKELNCIVHHSCPLKGISFRNLKLNVQGG